MCTGKGVNDVGIEESDKWFETFVNSEFQKSGVELQIMEVLGAKCI
jgi:hypothetical protein